MVKVCHLDTFSMGETGPHIAILVLSVVPHFNSMVYSKIPASSASFRDCGVVGDDLGEPPRIEGHRPGPLGILNDQDSLLATTAGCQWCSTTGSPSNRPVSVHDPSKSREAASRTSRSLGLEPSLRPARSPKQGSGERSICRTRRPARFFCRGMRIRRAGSSPVRQPAGDKRIYHQLLMSCHVMSNQLLGSGRRVQAMLHNREGLAGRVVRLAGRHMC